MIKQVSAIIAFLLISCNTSSDITIDAAANNTADVSEVSMQPIVSDIVVDSGVSMIADSIPVQNSHCPAEMAYVSGNYCQQVEEICLKWLDPGNDPLRCAEFKNPTKCLSPIRKPLSFCMDRFEYPGEGTYPLVGLDYYQAKEIAHQSGKRLCTKEEFNFSCEGEDIRPYGYGDGYHRDATICNIDKPWIDYTKFSRESWNDIDGGLYQAVKSDRNSMCRSVFGIFNLNGNVDEILDSEHSINVILSSGYWSKIRARCRPSTDSHNKLFSFYQVGFRMCKDSQ